MSSLLWRSALLSMERWKEEVVADIEVVVLNRKVDGLHCFWGGGDGGSSLERDDRRKEEIVGLFHR